MSSILQDFYEIETRGARTERYSVPLDGKSISIGPFPFQPRSILLVNQTAAVMTAEDDRGEQYVAAPSVGATYGAGDSLRFKVSLDKAQATGKATIVVSEQAAGITTAQPIGTSSPSLTPLDSPVKLVVPAFTPVSGANFYPSPAATYDVSGYANLSGFVGLDPTSHGAGEITFRWYSDPDGTEIVGVQGMPLVSQIPSLAQLLIPNKGPFLRVEFEKIVPAVDPTATAPKLGMRIFGTNRTGRLPLDAPDTMQITYTARPIAAGGVEATYPADYFAGPCMIDFQSTPAGMKLELHDYDLTFVNYVMHRLVAPVSGVMTVSPFGAWFAFVQNPGAIGNYTLTITPNVTG